MNKITYLRKTLRLNKQKEEEECRDLHGQLIPLAEAFRASILSAAAKASTRSHGRIWLVRVLKKLSPLLRKTTPLSPSFLSIKASLYSTISAVTVFGFMLMTTIVLLESLMLDRITTHHKLKQPNK